MLRFRDHRSAFSIITTRIIEIRFAWIVLQLEDVGKTSIRAFLWCAGKNVGLLMNNEDKFCTTYIHITRTGLYTV